VGWGACLAHKGGGNWAGEELIDAGDQVRDVNAVLAELDGAVEWYDAAPMLLGGKATVFRGHEGVRALMDDLWGILDEIQVDFTEIRDLGDRIVATGHIRVRDSASGAELESSYGAVFDFENGKAIRVRTYVGAKALEAAGLRE
jgi:ketosteroid isomerase-like protein